jgi:hypothetical protein
MRHRPLASPSLQGFNMTTFTFQSPTAAVPRAGALLASLFNRLATVVRGTVADPSDSPSQASRIAEASAVRRYAQQFMGHDPRFAADLFAAADRHERL